MIETIDETEYLGVKIEKVDIKGYECKIGDKTVLFPTLEKAKDEIKRMVELQKQ